jgi:hypothetical protein
MFLEYSKKILHFPSFKKISFEKKKKISKKFSISKNDIICVKASKLLLYYITYQYKKSNKENLVFLESN